MKYKSFLKPISTAAALLLLLIIIIPEPAAADEYEGCGVENEEGDCLCDLNNDPTCTPAPYRQARIKCKCPGEDECVYKCDGCVDECNNFCQDNYDHEFGWLDADTSDSTNCPGSHSHWVVQLDCGSGGSYDTCTCCVCDDNYATCYPEDGWHCDTYLGSNQHCGSCDNNCTAQGKICNETSPGVFECVSGLCNVGEMQCPDEDDIREECVDTNGDGVGDAWQDTNMKGWCTCGDECGDAKSCSGGAESTNNCNGYNSGCDEYSETCDEYTGAGGYQKSKCEPSWDSCRTWVTDTCDDKCPGDPGMSVHMLKLNCTKDCVCYDDCNESGDCDWGNYEYDNLKCNYTRHENYCIDQSSSGKDCGGEYFKCTRKGKGTAKEWVKPGNVYNESNEKGNCQDGWDNDCDGKIGYNDEYCDEPPNASFTYSPRKPNNWDVITLKDTSEPGDGTIIERKWEFINPGGTKSPPSFYLDWDTSDLGGKVGCHLTINNLKTVFSNSTPHDLSGVCFQHYCNGSYDVPGTIIKSGGSGTVEGFYPDSGQHKVKLTVTDSNGLFDSVEHYVGSGCYGATCKKNGEDVRVRICPDWV